eukprot:scaffold1007_cov23-Cyclotella_meneghiniana.AAC.3
MTSVLTGRVDGTTADVVIDCQSTTITNDIIGDDQSNDLSANHVAIPFNEITRDEIGRYTNHNPNNIHTTYNASSTNDDDFQQQLLIRRWIRLQQLTIILILGDYLSSGIVGRDSDATTSTVNESLSHGPTTYYKNDFVTVLSGKN